MSEGLIIIPAFNEELNIIHVIKDIQRLGIDIDILVVDDGSIDRTREEVLTTNVNILCHPYNLGYGAALQTGYKYAKKRGYRYVIQFDGDGQHNAKNILNIIDELNKQQVDIVICSRFLDKSSFQLGVLKKVVIELLKFLIRISTSAKITDPTSGLKGLSKRTYEYYAAMDNFPNDYPDADILIQMLLKGFKIREISASMRQRVHGKSMHSGLKPIVYLVKMLLSILVVILRDKLLKEEAKHECST